MKKELIRILVALALLLGLLFFVRWHRSGQERDAERKGKEAQVLSIKTEKIERLKVSTANGTVTLVRTGGEPVPEEFSEIPDWRITEPVKGFADRATVATLFGNLKGLTSVKVISEDGKGAADFGLDPARITIEAFPKEGNEPLFVLRGGDLNTAGTGMYVQAAGNPRILLTETTLDPLKTRKLFDWRMKEIIGFKVPAAIRKVTVETLKEGKPVRVTAERDDSKKWVLTEPEKARADGTEVDTFFNELSSLRASDIPSEDAAKDARRFGFDRPSVRVIVVPENGETRELTVGSEEKGKSTDFPLRRNDLPQVFLISSYLKNRISKDLQAWVAKNPFDLEAASLTAIEIEQKGSTTELWRKDGKWNAAKPAGLDLDEGKVLDLIAQLTGLKAKEYLGKKGTTPAGKPDLRIRLTAGDQKRDAAFFTDARVFATGVWYRLNPTDRNRIPEMAGDLTKTPTPAPAIEEEKE